MLFGATLIQEKDGPEWDISWSRTAQAYEAELLSRQQQGFRPHSPMVFDEGVGKPVVSVVWIRYRDPKKGETAFTNTLGMEFVLVPKGKSWLGGGGGQPGTRLVNLPNDFYLGRYEVTQEEWQKVMGNNPSHFCRSGEGKGAVNDIPDADLKRFPVDSVSWEDCRTFVERLNELLKEPGWRYHLPTDVEWEYACRGGPLSDRAASAFDFYLKTPTDELRPQMANFRHDKALNKPCKVGLYPPNPLGLYDMHGNVGECCLDDWRAGKEHVGHMGRGGSWRAGSNACTARFAGNRQTVARIWRGLRLARVPTDAATAQ